MRYIRNIFLTGLAVVVPIVLTAYVLYWLGTSAESFLGGGIKLFVPDRFYVPGMGLAVGMAIVLATGLLARALIFRRLIEGIEAWINRIPLVKMIYGSIRDLMNFFSDSKERGFSRVVLVTLEQIDARIVGFVTREDLTGLPEGIHDSDRIAVYLPMSYQLGGFTFLVPRSAVRPIAMSMQEAFRFTMTGGVTRGRASGASH